MKLNDWCTIPAGPLDLGCSLRQSYDRDLPGILMNAFGKENA